MVTQFTLLPPDTLIRQNALDIAHSWIVQAPAGSGKTQLLTQRFLKLLAHVQHEPEEILAITFTRKAAEEMRHRILQTLENARENNDNLSELTHWAKEVLKRDQAQCWNLLKNPGRLRITTIDSFCVNLVQQMPIESGMGGKIRITENADFFYRMVAEQIFEELDSDATVSQAFTTILSHLENHAQRLITLFSDLLANREQWLYDIMPLKSSIERRQTLEENLKVLCESELSKLQESGQTFFSNYVNALKAWFPHLFSIINYVAAENPWKDFQIEPNFSNYSAEYIEQWRGLSKWLLTKEDNFRRKFTKNEGKIKSKELPLELRQQNDLFLEFLTEFLGQAEQQTEWINNLAKIKNIPNPHYSDKQWELIEALLEVLPSLVSRLNILFQEHQTADFTQMSLSALKALGTADEPTDLTLKLDQKIQHILVDEFQDTSVLQYRLLEQLTAGWHEGDGKTLFLVGDPMQGIYRFRKAEVSLFLKIKGEGLGQVEMFPLQLQANFRTETSVVQWVNQLFKKLLPQKDELHIGAVAYNDSLAIKPNEYAEIQWIATENKDDMVQAKVLLNQLKLARENHPQASQVILVRSKSHAQVFLRLLREEGLSFIAADIETLYEHPLIQDLLILTRVCWQLSDRTAWFALLRAPWCGLTLNDLHIIHQNSLNTTLWSVLKNCDFLEKLSPNGQERLIIFLQYFKKLMLFRGKISTAEWITKAWLELSLGKFLKSSEEEIIFENFLTILKSFENQNRQGDIQGLLNHLESLNTSAIYMNSDEEKSEENPIHIMTIHKSKGLEFDHVFLPFLHRSSQGDQNPLLLSSEYIDFNQKTRWILAPIKSYGSDLLYDFMKRQENLKNEQEIIRLYYVALTRAKSKIFLHADFSKIKITENEKISFDPGVNPWLKSMMSFKEYQKAWYEAYIKNKHLGVIIPINKEDIHASKIKQYFLSSNPSDYELSSYYAFHQITAPERTVDAFFGTFLHKLLEYQISLEKLNESFLFKEFLLYGFHEKEAMQAVPLIFQALKNMQNDPQAQWILKNAAEGKIEWALTHVNNNHYSNIRIDLSFIDAEGIQWIIDFKTHASLNLDQNHLTSWLEHQRNQHKTQLEYYAQTIKNIHSGRIMLGLYFPLIPHFISWEFENAVLV